MIQGAPLPKMFWSPLHPPLSSQDVVFCPVQKCSVFLNETSFVFGYGTPYLIENQLLYALFCFSRFTTKYVSPQLIKSEMQSVNNSESAIEDLMVSSSTVQMIQQSGMEFQVISEVVTCQSV